MIEFSRRYVSIFGFNIYFYGMIIAVGAILAIVLAARETRRRGMEENFLYDALPWVMISGIIGARVWHIFTPPPSMVAMGITTEYYLTHPLDALNFRAGGLGIPGAVIGGLLAFYIFSRMKGLPLAAWLDVLAPAVPLGQAIGRWGNFINQEVYGAPTDLPWGIFIEPAYRLPEFASETHYHPIFLYESLWNLASVFVLLWLARKFANRLRAGDLFLCYLISYPFIRFLLDFLRLDASEVAGVNANQTVMAVVMVLAGLALFLRHRFTPPEEPAADPETPIEE